MLRSGAGSLASSDAGLIHQGPGWQGPCPISMPSRCSQAVRRIKAFKKDPYGAAGSVGKNGQEIRQLDYGRVGAVDLPLNAV